MDDATTPDRSAAQPSHDDASDVRAQLTGPPLGHEPHPHLLAALWQWAEEDPDAPAVAVREGDRFAPHSVRWLRDRVREVAAGLVALGVQPGERVALLSRTRLAWTIADHAILAAGAVTVPLYDSAARDQIAHVLTDSEATVAIVEHPEQRELLDGLGEAARTVRRVEVIEHGGLDALAERADTATRAEVDRRRASLGPHDLATIVYSSGTTGAPKGCALTHGNLTWNAAQTMQHLPQLFDGVSRTLVFLPLAHVFARIQVIISLQGRAQLCFASSVAQLREELPMAQPSFLVAVPRVFEKLLEAGRNAAAQRGRLFATLFDATRREADARFRALERGQRPGPVARARWAVLDRLVGARLRAALGGEMRWAISGGAALPSDVARLFNAIGVPLLEGYGLTETSPILTGDPPERPRPGSVGRAMPGTELRLSQDGELQVRGPQVFQGYWRNPQATAEMFADDWLRTGDLARFDGDGCVWITGRMKELIVTAGGKNVSPGPLEDLVRAHPLVGTCIVVGEGRPYIGALITLDAEQAPRWARQQGLERDDVEALAEHPQVRAAIAEAVDAANATVSQAEQIRRFRILPRDLGIASGELTPTLKVRRAVVGQRYATEIEALYAEDEHRG